MKKTLLFVVLAGLAACSPERTTEPVAPKASSPESAEVKASTPSVAGEVLNAPGNYLKSTVGQIEKAKEAKKIFEAAQAEHMKLPEGE